jgi:SPIRAL1-like protein
MTSSNAFASGANQNSGNVLTDRPTTRTRAPPGGRSSISFGADGEGLVSANERPTTWRQASAAKMREFKGASKTIFGGEAEDEETTTRRERTAKKATKDDVRAMMLADLRALCRRHGLSPAGSRDTLIERACEAMDRGECECETTTKPAGGVSTMENNYGRAGGQNVGNFLTDRKTSRVLREPGGGSSFIFGGESPPKARGGGSGNGWSPGSQARDAAVSAINGSDIFACPELPKQRVSEAKLAEQRGNNVFDQTLPERRPLTSHRQASLAQLQGGNIFDDTLPQVRRSRGGVSCAPGGNSSISFEAFFLPASDDEGADEDDGRDRVAAAAEPVVEEPEDPKMLT